MRTLPVPEPTVIYVTRHAEVHNPRDIVYGRLPRFRLSEHGRVQARRTADLLAPRPITAIYSSPLLRARQTSEIIGARLPGAAVHTDSRLTEVRTGYQGESNRILKPGFSFYDPRAHEDDETMEDVFARMWAALVALARRHSGQSLVLVSHGDPIAILRVGLEGRALTSKNLHSNIYPERSSVTAVQAAPGSPVRLTYFDVTRTVAA